MEYQMKKILRIIGAILTIVKLSVAYEMDSNDPYLSGNILGSVQNISISKLLDYKKIAAAIDDEFDRARFHYIIAFEIEQRKNILDKKFNLREKKYIKAIKSYEKELDLTLHKFANDKPRFDHIYQKADITEEAIIQFQTDMGYSQDNIDGIVGLYTLNGLINELKRAELKFQKKKKGFSLCSNNWLYDHTRPSQLALHLVPLGLELIPLRHKA